MNLFRQIAANPIQLKDFPFFSELNIEAFILENPQVISNDDIFDPEIIAHQLPIINGRGNTDGRIDLLAKTEGYLIIIEVKIGMLNPNHIDQLTDYLDNFDRSILKDADKYHNHKLVGLLVGTDISNDVKSVLQDGNDKNQNMIGLTLKRFKTWDAKENYILTEFYQPKSSGLTRYDSWQQFEDVQLRNGIPKSILQLSKKIHYDFIAELKLTKENINYTPNTFTLNVSKTQRKKVFAYIILRKKDVKIYLMNNGKVPEGAKPHERFDRYPHAHFVSLTSMNDYTDTIKEMIRNSYDVVDKYYE